MKMDREKQERELFKKCVLKPNNIQMLIIDDREAQK